MKVIVCGGAGYIGTQMVRNLLKGNFEVIIVDTLEATKGNTKLIETEERWRKRCDKGEADVSAPRFAHLEVGDVRDVAFLSSVFTKHAPIDAVVHMCAYLDVFESVNEPLKYFDNNVIGMIRILQVMRQHKCNKIILSSTCSLYGNITDEHEGKPGGESMELKGITSDMRPDPINPYAETKLMCEMMLKDCAKAYGMRCISLRYFNACGADAEGDIGETHDPEVHLIPLVLRVALKERIDAFNAKHHPERPSQPSFVSIFGTDYPTRDGTCIRDYIHVYDLANAHICALNKLDAIDLDDGVGYFKHYNLGSTTGHSVREVIEAARRVTGHPIPAAERPRRSGDPIALVAVGEEAFKELNWKIQYDTIHKIVASAWKFHQKYYMGLESL